MYMYIYIYIHTYMLYVCTYVFMYVCSYVYKNCVCIMNVIYKQSNVTFTLVRCQD